ncbi:sialate O-acetylesterase [Lentisphaera marina]|uniref:sialate O-acetylesterase n=1 Tax=Lentisphaera marina TaxID=1111041 RepID=UPI0023660235|nr:sialate O-acetylesterase [Lentisphaera marina]MDD7984623.1 sialate O-acetylesterase [Lentisphaera marina]
MKKLGILLSIAASLSATADVQMSKMFGKGMVLQRELPVPVWGKADPGEQVIVSFADQEKSTVTGENGKWQVVLDPLQTSKEGQTLTVKGKNELSFNNVLVGEVWLCAGQSNMAGRFGDKSPFPAKYDKKTISEIRFNGKGNKGWDTIDQKSAKSLSRVAFYFGINLYEELNVPIGLITRHNGGTPMQAWMNPEDAEVARKALNIPEGWREEAKKQRKAGYQYNDKLKEVIPYAIRGAVWYQGERNAKSNTALEYDQLTVHFLDSWRKDWGERAGIETRKFPFYYVQIPTDIHLRNYEFPWVRDRQRRALEITENTGMAIFWEQGPGLHPADKKLAGDRLAGIALAKNYPDTKLKSGELAKDLVYSGPLLDKVTYSTNTARLSFKYVGSGLKERNGETELKYFELAGEDVKYHKAKAVINGDEVVVTCEAVNNPKYVRYLFNANPPVQESKEGAAEDKGGSNFSLMNKDGIPASAFITDNEIPGPRSNIRIKSSKEDKAARKAKQQAQKGEKDLRETQKDKAQQEGAESEKPGKHS